MKTSVTKISAAIALMAVSSMANAAISNTRHNLGTMNPGGNGIDDPSGTSEICIFCHTPHGGATNAPVPLWNRVTTTATFQTYAQLATGTLDGAEAGIGSISIACLSCHDGTQAMDVVLNSPGFGTTGTVNGTLGIAGWADGHRMDGTNSQGANLAAELVYIATDLTNDHPISIQYGGGGLTTGNLTTAASGLGDPDFVIPVQTTNAVGDTIWYIDRNGTAGKQKDDLPLYTRNFNTADQPTVECGSCHDPHVANPTFLRPAGGNAGSAVCLSCHTK
jgi:predicted CXXCH cytochrome family protein